MVEATRHHLATLPNCPFATEQLLLRESAWLQLRMLKMYTSKTNVRLAILPEISSMGSAIEDMGSSEPAARLVVVATSFKRPRVSHHGHHTWHCIGHLIWHLGLAPHVHFSTYGLAWWLSVTCGLSNGESQTDEGIAKAHDGSDDGHPPDLHSHEIHHILNVGW